MQLHATGFEPLKIPLFAPPTFPSTPIAQLSQMMGLLGLDLSDHSSHRETIAFMHVGVKNLELISVASDHRF
jgi:hypothetical protein